MTRPFLFVTSGRADWVKLEPVAAILQRNHKIRVLCVGGHLLDTQGNTVGGMHYRYLGSMYTANTHVPGAPEADFARTGEAVADIIDAVNPAACIVHGDRLEAAATAHAAWCREVPLVHIEAGERTGWLDDGWSRGTTAMAELALCANDDATLKACNLVRADALETGCPGYDAIAGISKCKSSRAELARHDLSSDDYVMVIVHPAGNAIDVGEALEMCRGENVIGWWPNIDQGSDMIASETRRLVPDHAKRWHKNMPRKRFLCLLKHAKAIAGNSSAAVREAGCFGTPAVLIGGRQNGRTLGPHVFDSLERCERAEPWWGYGKPDGRNAHRCVDAILDHFCP